MGHRVGDPHVKLGMQVGAIGSGEPASEGTQLDQLAEPPQPARLEGQHGVVDRVLAEVPGCIDCGPKPVAETAASVASNR